MFILSLIFIKLLVIIFRCFQYTLIFLNHQQTSFRLIRLPNSKFEIFDQFCIVLINLKYMPVYKTALFYEKSIPSF